MAHRMSFSSNTCVPLAVQVNSAEEGWLFQYDPVEEESLSQAAREDLKNDVVQAASIDHPLPAETTAFRVQGEGHRIQGLCDLLALDLTPFDPQDKMSEDTLSMIVRFHDPLGRSVEIRADRAVPGYGNDQRFGGVATNLFGTGTTDFHSADLESWRLHPLVAWGAFEVKIDGQITDKDMLGLTQLDVYPYLTRALGDENYRSEEPACTLSLTLYPRQVASDGMSHSFPLQAAEDLNMAGWTLIWNGIDYTQAPVFSVRAERNDTLSKIAKEMSVSPDLLVRANADFSSPNAPVSKSLVRVPYILRAHTEAKKKEHPSTALSWKEIIRGWTTLN